MFNYAPTMMQNQQMMLQNHPTMMQNQFNTMNSYPNSNTTNICSNFFPQPNLMMPQMPQQMPQMSQILQLLMGMMQMMFQGFPGGPQEVIKEEIIISDNTNVWGDPHYEVTGKNGEEIKFDHHGKAGNTYNVFSGDNLKIDGTYAPFGNEPCIINKTTIQAGNDVMTFNKEGQAALNGETLEQGTGTLRDGTTYNLEGKVLSVTPNDGTGTVNIKAQGNAMTIDPDGEFRGLGGIIGTAINESKGLTEEEANKFDVSDQYEKGELIRKQKQTNLANGLDFNTNYFTKWANPFNA